MKGAYEYRSDSLSESAEIIRREWPLQGLSVVGCGHVDLRFKQRRISVDMSVYRLSYGAEVCINLADCDDVLSIEMPVSGRAKHYYNSTEMITDPTHYGVADVRRITRYICDAEFDAVVLHISLARIRKYLADLLEGPLRRELLFHHNMAIDSYAWRLWAPQVCMLRSLVENAAIDYPPQLLASIEEGILSALIFSQPHTFTDDIRRSGPLPAPRHVKRAEAYVHEHAGEHLTTKMLAAHANVSVRALFDGFYAFRNVTPAEFIRNVRLDKARADLQEGSLNVSHIAAKWGFNNLSNFAANYKKRFGDTPADTRRFS